MCRIKIARDRKEAENFAGINVVIDLFRFSATVACLLEIGKKEIKIFSEPQAALKEFKTSDNCEFFSEMELDIDKFDNSPYKVLTRSSSTKSAIVITNSGARAVMSSKFAKEILISGFHNMKYVRDYLKNKSQKILIVPACLFYNNEHIEDIIASEAFLNLFLKNENSEKYIDKIKTTNRVDELISFRPLTAVKDMEIIFKSDIKKIPLAEIMGNFAKVENIAILENV